jgi:hypothetical protein
MMPGGSRLSTVLPRTSARALLRFTALWLLAGAAIAVALIFALGATGGNARLPPLRLAVLERALDKSGCRVSPREAAPLLAGAQDALRRGKVVIRYAPALPVERVEQLELVRRRVPMATVLVQGSAMGATLVIVYAWHHELRCTEFTDASLDAIRLFRARYIGRGPEPTGP